MSDAVVCPGSFDPLTMGHLDVIERAARHFDEVVVAVIDNPNKQAMFGIDERLEMVAAATRDFPNVRHERFRGLLVDFCRAQGIGMICKGLRGVGDFEYELRMAQMNRRIAGIETVFLSASPEHAYLSSSLVKEVARLGGSIRGTVPPRIEAALLARVAAEQDSD